MADSSIAGWMNQLAELMKILLSVIVGFFSSIFLKKYDLNKSKKNMKTILFKELSVNYDNLNKILPKDDKFHPALYDMPVQVCRSLQHAVYDSYLGRLSELHPHELEKIFDAYHRLVELQTEAVTINAADLSSRKEPQNVFQLRINVFLQNVSAAHKKIEEALGLFEDGRHLIAVSHENRGIEYQKIYELISRVTGKT